MDGAPEALQLFKNAGLDVFIATNQGGIGRGIYTQADMHAFNAHLCASAVAAGGYIKDIAFCPHHPKAITPPLKTPCASRKPGHAMLTGLAAKWSIDLAQSVMIGDRDTDVIAGQAAGCHAYLFDGGNLETLARQIIATHFPSHLEGLN
jgi:D-glycero-D-manno-heptose 1,7-bisphosphate phosphatase